MDKRPLRILIAEDNPADAEFMLRQLRRHGFEPDWRRVDTEADFLAALDSELAVILCDYSMPQFSGLRALDIVKERGLDIPFILVSATIGEETAVAAMRSGAADYLLKDRLARLGQAVENAMEQKRLHDERKRAATELLHARDDLAQKVLELEGLNAQLQREVAERKSAQQMLEGLRRHHELILNSVGEGICGLDLAGNFIFANSQAGQLLGWKADELLGKPVHATIHHNRSDGSEYPLEESPIFQSMHTGSPRRVTNDVFWRKNRTSFRVDYVCAPTKDAEGRVNGSVIAFKDNTEQFAADARLKLQEQQYRLLFETNPSPMWISDAQTLQILAVNEAAITQYGYSREEFLKLNVNDLQPAEDEPDLPQGKAFSSSAISHFSGQYRHIRKDRSLLLVEIYSGPVVWDGVRARIVTAIDVTERKQAEERMREQADIIDRARDAVIVRDFQSDRITVWNTGAERLYGWSAGEAIGRPMGEMIFAEPSDRDAFLEQLISAGEFHGQIKHRARDGREVIVDSRVTLIRNDDGTPRSVLGINTDITEQKKLETQLLRSQRLESIGTLASGVAHDLNNVLTPILMCAEALRDKATDEDTEATLSLIDDSARRGAAIVKQVLTFARGVEGERVLIKPAHLIEEMVDIARKTFPKSIEITHRYPEDLRTIEADPTQLHQVLLNLSVNARDAMPNGGRLTISGEDFDVDEHYASMRQDATVGPYVAFTVSDTGMGMPKANIDKIFDPFFTTKDVGKGTGLGLSTALGIVKSHGGFISVYSELGSGTTFKVFLPAQADDQTRVQVKTLPELLKGHGETILVVDDEPTVRTAAKMILEKNDYHVLVANDGPEALAAMAEHGSAIDIVLTDLSMPYMDGVALVRATRKMKPDSAFIVMTGQGEQNRVTELAALKVANFLSKPYSTEKLLLATRAALEGRGGEW